MKNASTVTYLVFSQFFFIFWACQKINEDLKLHRLTFL